jgi:molybdate transport system ATP-binding protein
MSAQSGTSLRAQLRARVGSLAIDLDLDTAGGTLVLVGPNGAGKTSLFLLLLGVLPAEQARISVGEVVLCDSGAGLQVPVEQRRLGYVPQDYALFPHLSVRDNVAFAVASTPGAHDVARDAEQVEAALRDLGILALAARMPGTLSGGEKQRVALARALSVRPHALLLDEPLAALDVHARREVRTFLAETLKRLALPSLVITHDPHDARALGDRIAVIEAGQLTQLGAWSELVARPATRFVEQLVSAA